MRKKGVGGKTRKKKTKVCHQQLLGAKNKTRCNTRNGENVCLRINVTIKTTHQERKRNSRGRTQRQQDDEPKAKIKQQKFYPKFPLKISSFYVAVMFLVFLISKERRSGRLPGVSIQRLS